MINIIDRIVQYANRYKDQNNNTLTLTPLPGTVTAEGTPVNRALFMALQGFHSNDIVFNPDGSITETNGDGDTLVTTFPADGSIIETFTAADGTQISKTTVFNDDGSIAETIS